MRDPRILVITASPRRAAHSTTVASTMSGCWAGDRDVRLGCQPELPPDRVQQPFERTHRRWHLPSTHTEPPSAETYQLGEPVKPGPARPRGAPAESA